VKNKISYLRDDLLFVRLFFDFFDLCLFLLMRLFPNNDLPPLIKGILGGTSFIGASALGTEEETRFGSFSSFLSEYQEVIKDGKEVHSPPILLVRILRVLIVIILIYLIFVKYKKTTNVIISMFVSLISLFSLEVLFFGLNLIFLHSLYYYYYYFC